MIIVKFMRLATPSVRGSVKRDDYYHIMLFVSGQKTQNDKQNELGSQQGGTTLETTEI